MSKKSKKRKKELKRLRAYLEQHHITGVDDLDEARNMVNYLRSQEKKNWKSNKVVVPKRDRSREIIKAVEEYIFGKVEV